MYDGGVTIIRYRLKKMSEFSITIALHQGSALNLYLFALVMDKLIGHIQDVVPWCRLFADDIVLMRLQEVSMAS